MCSHKTGHAEAVRLQYDPERIGYKDLLAAFFAMHDPTTLDRQGPDVGSQYRSAVFALDDEQEQAARDYVARLESSGRFKPASSPQSSRPGRSGAPRSTTSATTRSTASSTASSDSAQFFLHTAEKPARFAASGGGHSGTALYFS